MDHLIKAELERRLKRKRAEVAALDEKIAQHEEGIRDCQEEMSMAQATINELQSLYNLIPTADADGAQTTFRQNSDGWLVHRLLVEFGSPLYIDKILEELDREITPDSRASLAGQLGGYVRKGQVFTRPLPNTFGLREWEVNGHRAQAAEAAPPLDLSDDDALQLEPGDVKAANNNQLEDAA